MQTVRIDVRRLAKALLFTLVLPLSLAIVLDLSLDTMPVATIAASVVCIPLASVFVIRAALSELDKVIQAVAPPEPATLEQPAETAEAGSANQAVH